MDKIDALIEKIESLQFSDKGEMFKTGMFN